MLPVWYTTLYKVSSQIDVLKHVQAKGLESRLRSSSRSLKICRQKKGKTDGWTVTKNVKKSQFSSSVKTFSSSVAINYTFKKVKKMIESHKNMHLFTADFYQLKLK